MASALNQKKTTLTQSDINVILEKTGYADLASEICPEGAGEEFHAALSKGQEVDALEFYRWQHTEGKGAEALHHLQSEYKFRSFEELEHYSNTWKLRVSRDSENGTNYSIGYLFGMMEDIQAMFDISEYAIAQTTLE